MAIDGKISGDPTATSTAGVYMAGIQGFTNVKVPASLFSGADPYDPASYGASPSASAAVNAAAFGSAIDQAILDGLNFIHVGAAYNITGVDLTKINSVIPIGGGSISGAYRKEVFDTLAPPPSDRYDADVIPAIHLKRLNSAYDRTGIINVVLFGDSISTYQPGPGSSRMDRKVEAYRAALLRQFPDATINFYNRSIGGMSFADWNRVDAGSPATYTWYVAGTAWNTHIGLVNPDLVVVAMGMNYLGTAQDVVDLRTYLGTLNCDVLWETCVVPSLAYSGFTQSIDTDRRDGWAGFIRSYAKYLGTDGVVDFHRRFCIMRDGFDVRRAHSLEGTKETITAVANICQGTQQCRNHKATAHFDASAWANGSTTTLQFIVSGNAALGYDYVGVKKSAGGFWQFQWASFQGGVAFVGPGITTASAVSVSATAQMTMEVRDDIATFYLKDGQASVVSEEPIYTSRLVRKNILAAPYVGLALIVGGSLTSVDFVYTEQKKSLPQLTDADFYQTTYYTSDGPTPVGTNAINHPSSAGMDAVYLPVLEQIVLREDMGKIFFQADSVVTPNTTVETVLAQKAIAANQIKVGQRGRISVAIGLGADGNTKTVRIKMASTTVGTYTGAQNGGGVRMECDFYVAASGFTTVAGTISAAAGVTQINATFANSGWASANNLQVTGQNGTGGVANEINMIFCLFDLLPKPA